MNIALVSCANLPDWEVDDQPLTNALKKLGATVHHPSWTETIDWNQFDLSVIRTTWDYHHRKFEFVNWCKTVPRLFNNAQIVQWNTHKSYLQELETSGTKIAPTIWINKNENVDINKIMCAFECSKGFIKPQIGACASDTLRFSMDELELAQQFLTENIHQDMMVQPYLES
ncbi:MAG: hypothetical protein QF718_08640, partial [Phycisphaerales bacterium]|nr:hypothetical protein [Phycisphaerales bacterium]